MTYCTHPHPIEQTAKVGGKTFTVLHCPTCGDTYGKQEEA
jgi:hypothetical protein